MRRLAIPVLLTLTLLVGACGDVLDGIGGISQRVVHGDDTSSTTTSPPEAEPALNLGPVTQTVWMNASLDAGVDVLSRESLIASIWRRGTKDSAYVQASRREIAAALPGIEFPRLIPSSVRWISSQLVYDLQTVTLDPATSAAFGLWTTEPYTAPRSEAQVAVLRVGVETVATESDEEIYSFRVSDGRELTWIDGGYAYQLFCRTGISEDACFAIARSTTLLAVLSEAREPAPEG